MTKRHAKPTSAQLAARTYRKVAGHRFSSLASIHANGDALQAIDAKLGLLMERVSALNPIVDHCARLLKEKETLQRQVEAMKNAPLFSYDSAAAIPQAWPNAPRSVSVPMTFIGPPDFQAARHGACAFASSHRAGIRCGVCGETGT